VGSGTQECFKHLVLDSDDMGLRPARAQTELGPLFGGIAFVRDGADEQANGSDPSIRVDALGLLATESAQANGGDRSESGQ
jgi:hypothetical protein